MLASSFWWVVPAFALSYFFTFLRLKAQMDNNDGLKMLSVSLYAMSVAFILAEIIPLWSSIKDLSNQTYIDHETLFWIFTALIFSSFATMIVVEVVRSFTLEFKAVSFMLNISNIIFSVACLIGLVF